MLLRMTCGVPAPISLQPSFNEAGAMLLRMTYGPGLARPVVKNRFNEAGAMLLRMTLPGP